MEEQASFETRAVLEPRRAHLARLALLLPAAALVAFVWAGLNGPRSDPTTADVADPTAAAAPSLTAVQRPRHPAEVLGLDVHRLEDIQPLGLGPGEVIAVAGWYVPMAITDCPPLAAIYRDGALPYLRGDADARTFCVRSGVLYASQPGLHERSQAGVSTVATTFVVGVIAPLELEIVGSESTEVVVLGRFVESRDGCRVGGGCLRELLVDHVAWTPDA
jgi:hypothetical protein